MSNQFFCSVPFATQMQQKGDQIEQWEIRIHYFG